MAWATLGSTTLNVLRNTITFGQPDEITNRRTISMSLRVSGTDADAVGTTQAAIQAELRKAKQFAVSNTPITFVWQPGTTDAITFDLLPDDTGECGSLQAPQQAFDYLETGSVALLQLVLSTSAYGRGERQVATNLLLDSNDPTTGNWAATNLTVTANATTAPNGATVAHTLRETTTNGKHSLSQTVTKAASALNYAAIFYVQAHTRTYADITIQDSGGSNGVVVGFLCTGDGSINFTPSAFGSGFSSVVYGIAPDQNDATWYRCYLVATTDTSTSVQQTINIRSAAGTNSYAGNTSDGINIAFPALQQASIPGPYLETGSTLTITNGSDSTVYLYGLQGDVPGLTRLTISDVSTNSKVINDVRVGAMSLDDLAAGDYQGIITVTPESGASTTSTTAVSANIAQLTATSSPQTLGTFTKPAGAPRTDGPLHVFGRVRDHTGAVGQPQNLTGEKDLYRAPNYILYHSSSAATTHTITFNAPYAGNMLFLSVSALAGSPTITTPSGWTQAETPHTSTGGKTMSHYYKTADGTETSVNVALSSSQHCNALYIELTGIAYTSELDKHTGSTGTTDPASGTTAATTQANEFAVATILTDDSGAGTPTFSNSWTSNLRTALPVLPAHKFFYAYKHLTATGAQNTGFTDSSSGDYVGVISTYKGITTAAPDLNSFANYTCRVAGVASDGTVGQASDAITVNVGSTGALTLYWDAPASGSVDHYRVYFQRGSNAWKFFDTTNTYTVYTLTTETSPTGTGDPVLAAASGFGQYRLSTALNSGTVWHDRNWVSSRVAGGVWEIIPFGVVEGTEALALWGDDPIGWQWRVQCKHQTDTPLMDVDCLFVLPADLSVLHLFYNSGKGSAGATGDLATKRDWRSDLRPDWTQSAVLLETGTTTEAGQAKFDGRLFIGPKAAQLVFCPLVGSLISDVVDCAYQIQIEHTPLYLMIDGGQ